MLPYRLTDAIAQKMQCLMLEMPMWKTHTQKQQERDAGRLKLTGIAFVNKAEVQAQHESRNAKIAHAFLDHWVKYKASIESHRRNSKTIFLLKHLSRQLKTMHTKFSQSKYKIQGQGHALAKEKEPALPALGSTRVKLIYTKINFWRKHTRTASWGPIFHTTHTRK